MCDSIKSQEIAIEKVKDKMAQLQLYKDTGLLKDSEAGQLQELNSKLEVMKSKLSQSKDEANQLGKEVNKALNKKASFLDDSLGGVKEKIEGCQKGIEKFGKRISDLLKSVLIFNVLSGLLRNLTSQMGNLLKTNDQFASSLNKIKANLMTAFAPIYNACLPAINSLMNALSKITGTMAVFISGLFGTSLEDATEQAQGLSKALKGTAKSGKEASGGLADFDNLQLIGDTGGGINADSGTTGIDYSGELKTSQKLLDFLNKIKELVVNNKELVTSFLFGLVSGLAALKMGFTGIKSLGIGVAITGIIMTIGSLLEYLKAPTWENFGKIITGVGLAIAGVALVFNAWPLAVAGAIAAIIGLVVSNWEKIKDFLLGIVDWIFAHIEEIGDKFGWFGQIISVLFAGWLSGFTTFLDHIFGGAKDILDGIIKIFKGDFKGGIEQIFGGLIKIVTAPFAALYEAGKIAWEGIKKIFSPLAEFFGNIFSSAWRKVKDVFSVGGKVFDGIKEGIVESFKKIVNAIISGINKVVSTPFNAINKVLSKFKNLEIAGFKPFNGIIQTISVPQIPRLAKGTVIPPRQEFMAILGDQKHGTNIEAPLSTIEEALENVLNRRGMSQSEREIILRDWIFYLQLGDKTAQKFVIDMVRKEEKTTGEPLFVS